METVARSPADVLRLAVAGGGLVVLLVVDWLFGDTLAGFASDLLRGLEALPDWLTDLVIVGTRLLGAVVLVGGLVWMVAHTRWRTLATVAVAGGVAAVIAAVLIPRVTTSDGPAPLEVTFDLRPVDSGTFPTAVGLAVVTAVLSAAAPWLSRRWRRLGWALAAGLILCRFFSSPASFTTPVAATIGWFSGAAVLVVLGAPSRRPTMDAVIEGLSDVGLQVRELAPAAVDARGSTPYFGVALDGTKLFVKALGADERSADLLFRFYRRLQPRDYGDERPFSSLRRGVEHEALVALSARALEVSTPRLLAFATAEPNGCVLAYEAIEGRSLDRIPPEDITDDVLAAAWQLVGDLRRHRIAHRDLRLANLFMGDDGAVWLIDFGFSELAATDVLLATDVAELLASTSICVGSERAVAAATAVIDRPGLDAAHDRLHLWSLSGATRSAQRQHAGLLDDLRRRVRQTAETADR